jgi:nucleotide-binding universal stress UspA family protein
MRTLASIRSILVPTDFSNESQIAFAHALRLAIALKAELEVLHVEPDNDQQDWKFGPHVIRLLTQWGYLGANATDDDVAALGIHVRKTMVVGADPDRAILSQIAEAHADLVVIATHGRAGLKRLLQPSVSAPVATKGSVPVLCIPHNARTFVDLETGEPTLRRILIPVDIRPHPAPAFDAASIFARALPQEKLEIAALHVGPGVVETGWLEPLSTWTMLDWRAEGGVVDNVIHTATTWSADLMVCVTEGRRGLLDAIRGSTVERLLRDAPTPLLIVPHEWGTDQVGTR